ncbi:hypothetical protein [Pirellulimonas nuda]|uniref:hypothetical protein n=1 Tax=Pirellulimonas nuda TaxID=2528009 RepID=UPI0018D34F2E|nr:hypothetical protein [Pirellulimonas nuda]
MAAMMISGERKTGLPCQILETGPARRRAPEPATRRLHASEQKHACEAIPLGRDENLCTLLPNPPIALQYAALKTAVMKDVGFKLQKQSATNCLQSTKKRCKRSLRSDTTTKGSEEKYYFSEMVSALFRLQYFPVVPFLLVADALAATRVRSAVCLTHPSGQLI